MIAESQNWHMFTNIRMNEENELDTHNGSKDEITSFTEKWIQLVIIVFKVFKSNLRRQYHVSSHL